MHSKLPLLATASLAGFALILTSLNAADAPASTPASAPAAASTSAAPAASAPAASGASPRPAAAAPDVSKLPPASDKKDLTFDKDIAPILKTSCATCHGETRPKAGFVILTKEAILKGGQKGKDIVPGHSDQSLVVLYAGDLVARAEMPPLRNRTGTPPIPALTKEQLGLVRAWIDQGAK